MSNHLKRLILAIFLIGISSPILLIACGKSELKKSNDGLQAPKNLPDVPLYPTGRVVERVYAPDGSFQIRLLTRAKKKEILDFYDQRLPEFGWKKVGNYTGDEILVIYQKEKKLLHLSIFPSDNPEEIIHVLSYKE